MSFRPTVIRAKTIWTGTSITASTHTGGVANGYPALVGRDLPFLQINNIAVGSSTLDSANQAATADAAFVGSRLNILCVEFGTNDGVSVAAATFLSTLKTWCASRRSAHPQTKIVMATMLPCASYDSVAFRATVNSDIQGDPSFYDVLADVGNTNTTMGAEAAKNNAGLYPDGVHPGVAGNLLLYPIWLAAIKSLITPLLGGTSQPEWGLFN